MKIYLTCFNIGIGSGRVRGSTVGGDVMGYALCEDGEGLASHLSSHEDFSKHDLGLTSSLKHDIYKEHCPSGFELEWVDNPDTHEGWKKALELNRKNYPQEAGKC